jgi:hypothetical protein
VPRRGTEACERPARGEEDFAESEPELALAADPSSVASAAADPTCGPARLNPSANAAAPTRAVFLPLAAFLPFAVLIAFSFADS